MRAASTRLSTAYRLLTPVSFCLLPAMIVPNYIPEPLEVPGNITEELYPIRLMFIRRVAVLHVGSLAFIALLTNLSFPQMGLLSALFALAVCLTGLDLLRIALRGKASEARISALCLPTVLVLVAWGIREISLDGWPVFQPIIGVACVVVYTLISGRDFSFVGCCLLSLIASSAVVAACAGMGSFDRIHAAFALGTNAVYVTYLVYDMASLLARRRKGEEIAAVVDLYRDVFNFFGYAVRMVKHWRKHRIWNAK